MRKKTIFVIFSFFISSTVWAGQNDAQNVAQNSPSCRSIRPFYWEIGDGKNTLASGATGQKYQRNTELKIASASKLIFAAYVLEKKQGQLNPSDEKLLQMQGGYDQFNPLPCALRRTVEACSKARSNSQINPKAVGQFSYSGGHAQALALRMGLGSMNSNQLTEEVRTQLGRIFNFEYENLALAGGVETSAEQYALLLQALINNKLYLSSQLGKKAICTLPGPCPTARFSPVKENWSYSYHHWVELDENGQTEAFSSPGAFGFYPWISADKKFYGIVARSGLREGSDWDSVLCGREIRRAFFK